MANISSNNNHRGFLPSHWHSAALVQKLLMLQRIHKPSLDCISNISRKLAWHIGNIVTLSLCSHLSCSSSLCKANLSFTPLKCGRLQVCMQAAGFQISASVCGACASFLCVWQRRGTKDRSSKRWVPCGRLPRSAVPAQRRACASSEHPQPQIITLTHWQHVCVCVWRLSHIGERKDCVET